MLYIVLILVLAALGLVVTALITANSLWAWISIGLSVLAGVLLVTDWLRRRSKSTAAPDAEGETEEAGEVAEAKAEDSSAAEDSDTAEDDAEDEQAEQKSTQSTPKGQQTALLPASGELKSPSGDPAEEQTDAADLLVVSELETEVLVVDEYPRYHVGDCSWLTDRDTIPLPAKEARDLGFTPCALCGPDAKLAAEHRGKKKTKKSS